MSRRKKNVKDSKPIQAKPTYTADAYSNVAARLGAGSNSLTETSGYVMNRLTKDYLLINTLYRSSWIVGKIIDIIAEDMTKNWITVSTIEKSAKDIKNMERYVNTIKLKQQILEGIKWGRLYGGALGIIIIKGQENELDQPLDYNSIMPDSFRGLIIVDRWQGISPSMNLIKDIDNPDFGKPEYYDISAPNIDTTRVHHTRCVRFTGKDLPFFEKQQENYWGMSEVERVYEEVNKRDSASANISGLLFMANLRVLKMDNLAERLAMGNPEDTAIVINVLEAQNELMSSQALQILSKDDNFETHPYSFGGINEVYESFMLDVSGACEIPATKLFGRAPAGMNATGESDMQQYYDSINQKQEIYLRPVIEKLLPILCLSVWGEIPQDTSFEFDAVRQPTSEERKTMSKDASDSIIAAYQAGVITQKMTLTGLKKSDEQAQTSTWSFITQDDIDKSNNEFDNPADLLSSQVGSEFNAF